MRCRDCFYFQQASEKLLLRDNRVFFKCPQTQEYSLDDWDYTCASRRPAYYAHAPGMAGFSGRGASRRKS